MKLTDIIGLEEKHAKLLYDAGIREIEDLLALSYYQIKQLARSIGVSVKTLDTWQEHADLMRVESISPEIANALNLIGIDSLKELAYRNAKSSLERLKKLKQDLQSHFVIAMDEKGSEYTSREFAGFIEKMMVSGKEHITFILGGHDGLALELLKSADMTISLSRLTFTHQMVRLIFIEQLYRAFTIIKGEAYHH